MPASDAGNAAQSRDLTFSFGFGLVPNRKSASCSLSIASNVDWANCASGDPSRIFDGCRAVINDTGILESCLAAAHFQRGTAYARAADYEEALNDFGEAIALDWFHTASYANRGLALEAMGNVKAAQSDYDIVLAMPPDTAPAQMAQAKARERLAFSESGEVRAIGAADFVTDYQTQEHGVTGQRQEPRSAQEHREQSPGDIGVALPPEMTWPQPRKEPHKVVRVFFGTDRKRTESTVAAEAFGGDRGDLAFGICEVSIPSTHAVGELEEPGMLEREDPERHVVLLDVKDLSKGDFLSELRTRIAELKGKKAFLYVHGVSFRDAARRTAQLHTDLNFDGAPVCRPEDRSDRACRSRYRRRRLQT